MLAQHGWPHRLVAQMLAQHACTARMASQIGGTLSFGSAEMASQKIVIRHDTKVCLCQVAYNRE